MPKKRKNPESEEESDESESIPQKSAKKTKKIAKKKEEKQPSKKKKADETKNQPQKAKPKKIVEGKQDFLPGQKYAFPAEEDGAAQFYRTLYAQNPKSQIARKYVLQYGILQGDQAKKLYNEIGKKK